MFGGSVPVRLTRNQLALLVALGIDHFGSGLFVPLPVLYAIQVVGLPVSLAGTIITAGTLAGIASPPLAGRLVDRFGPRQVVIVAQVLQAAGAAAYLLAANAASIFVAALLLAAGQQAFYSSVFALIADTAGQSGPKDQAFALVGMVRGACFGLGGLAAGILAGIGPTGYRIGVGADGVTFLIAAAFLAFFLRLPHTRHHGETASVGVLRNRPYLALILATRSDFDGAYRTKHLYFNIRCATDSSFMAHYSVGL